MMILINTPVKTWKPWKPVIVKKRLANCRAPTVSIPVYDAGKLPHQ
jgi:hypothetical protein